MARIESVQTIGPGFTRLHLSVGKKFSVQIVRPTGSVSMRRVINSIRNQDLGQTDFAAILKASLAIPTGSISASPVTLGKLDIVFLVVSGSDFTGIPEIVTA